MGRGQCLPRLKYLNNGRQGWGRGCLMKNMTNPLTKRGCSPAISRKGGHGHPLGWVGVDPVSLSVRCLGNASSPLSASNNAGLTKLDIYLISGLWDIGYCDPKSYRDVFAKR
ncbi:hypothetical protein TNCV_3832191 [Trichonephila clavipes]|nr:hypothetical protein TNCV_3832191 [Trichonephila clavipes]